MKAFARNAANKPGARAGAPMGAESAPMGTARQIVRLIWTDADHFVRRRLAGVQSGD